MIFLLEFLSYQPLISIYYLIIRINVTSMIFLTFSFLRKKKDSKMVKKDHTMEGRTEDDAFETNKIRNVELNTIVIEEPEQSEAASILGKDKIQKDTITISSKIEDKIEKIILKILFEDKSVKTVKLLKDKVLERLAQERITISAKIIDRIINQMNTSNKIEFTQTEGWKIKI